MPKLRVTKKDIAEAKWQFGTVDDEKLRLTLSTLADRYDLTIRTLIYNCYHDERLNSIYRAIRRSGVYQKGGKTGARHRKLIEFPNPYVFDFVDTVMKAIYGPDWLKNNQALKHELVRPWWVVERL